MSQQCLYNARSLPERCILPRGHRGRCQAPADPRIAALEAALRRADAQIGATPHGDNCFVSDEFPGNRCCCGKETALEVMDSVLETVEKPPSHLAETGDPYYEGDDFYELQSKTLVKP